jgi:hypothetical protein
MTPVQEFTIQQLFGYRVLTINSKNAYNPPLGTPPHGGMARPYCSLNDHWSLISGAGRERGVSTALWGTGGTGRKPALFEDVNREERETWAAESLRISTSRIGPARKRWFYLRVEVERFGGPMFF